MADPSKISELVNQVLHQTRMNNLDWKTTANTEAIMTVIAGGKYILKSFAYTTDEDAENAGPPSLAMYSKEGDLLIDVTYQTEGASLSDLVSIFELAKEKSLGISDALGEAIKALQELDDIHF